MQGKMNCAIVYGPRDIRMEQREIPQITADDVLVKVLRAGICGSDVGVYNYGGMAYGIPEGSQFGHELVGRVVEKGENVDGIEKDMIVFVDPVTAQPGGIGASAAYGAFSEYVSVQNAKVNYNIFPLRADINLDKAVLIEPVSVGAHGAFAFEPTAETNIVVLGAGAIGLGATAGLLGKGIKNIVVVDRDASRLEKAKELGVKTINTTEVNLRDELVKTFGGMEILPGNVCPFVGIYIDAAGAPSLLEECFGMGFVGTKYSLVAVYHTDLKFAGMQFLACTPTIKGSAGYNAATILEIIDNISNDKTKIETIVTAKYKHSDFPVALEAATHADKNMKVIIDYELN